MKLAYIGLGKMGLNMVERLTTEKQHEIIAFDPNKDAQQKAVSFGADIASSAKDAVEKLETERKIVFLMVPHQVVDSVIEEIQDSLRENDIVIDGGNSNFNQTLERYKKLKEKKIHFIDAGTSGGPSGARSGACLMVGGEQEAVLYVENLFKDIAAKNAYQHVGGPAAGHFVKMVHNGIEYGMMQAIAEGFEVMKKSDFDLDLRKVVDIYNNKSVIESRLVGWLQDGYEKYGTELAEISGEVSHSGEGLWTVETAKELGVNVPIIEGALQFRENSKGNPSYTGKVVSVLRNMFGGHENALK